MPLPKVDPRVLKKGLKGLMEGIGLLGLSGVASLGLGRAIGRGITSNKDLPKKFKFRKPAVKHYGKLQKAIGLSEHVPLIRSKKLAGRNAMFVDMGKGSKAPRELQQELQVRKQKHLKPGSKFVLVGDYDPAIVGHELGHAKNLETLKKLKATGLYRHMSGIGDQAVPASAMMQAFVGPSLGAAAMGTAAYLPKLTGEAMASLRSIRAQPNLPLKDKLRLARAFGTYASYGAIPFAAYGLKKFTDE